MVAIPHATPISTQQIAGDRLVSAASAAGPPVPVYLDEPVCQGGAVLCRVMHSVVHFLGYR